MSIKYKRLVFTALMIFLPEVYVTGSWFISNTWEPGKINKIIIVSDAKIFRQSMDSQQQTDSLVSFKDTEFVQTAIHKQLNTYFKSRGAEVVLSEPYSIAYPGMNPGGITRVENLTPYLRQRDGLFKYEGTTAGTLYLYPRYLKNPDLGNGFRNVYGELYSLAPDVKFEHLYADLVNEYNPLKKNLEAIKSAFDADMLLMARISGHMYTKKDQNNNYCLKAGALLFTHGRTVVPDLHNEISVEIVCIDLKSSRTAAILFATDFVKYSTVNSRLIENMFKSFPGLD